MQVLGDNIGTTSTSTLQLYPWPPNGGTGVPLTFDAHESPNPYDLTPGVKQLGYLLSVNANGPWYSIYSTHMRISYASLVTDGGTPVQVTVADDNTPSIAPYLDADFALFPHGALKPATTYTARAVGKAENSSNSLSLPFDLTWHFTTAGKVTPAPKANRLKLSKGKVAGKKVNFTLTAAPVLVGHTAKLTKTIKRKGKPATVTSSSFKLKSSQTISVAPAPKGGSVKLTVSTGSFVREGLRYPAATASRTLSG
jgi:hypothetical protein